MNDTLQDLSDPSLIQAIENNLFEFLLAFRRWPEAEVHEDASIMWSITDVPFPLFNSIMRAQLASGDVDATIQSLIAQAGSRNVPLLWWTGPQTSPADLGSRLKEHGFVSDEDAPGMAVKLAGWKADMPAPAGLRVQRVEDHAALELWCRITCAGFELPDFVAEAFHDLLGHVEPGRIRAYLGWQGDRPVATSLLFLAAGVAGIYNVATIPEARRQGIGAVMTTVPLGEAQAMGVQAGILHASEMGAGVYRSLGFQEYCKIGQYIWAPESDADAI